MMTYVRYILKAYECKGLKQKSPKRWFRAFVLEV